MVDGWRMMAPAPGGPEVIERQSFTLPPPGPGEALIRHSAIGVNFIDTYHRSGLYPRPQPILLGTEAAGVVEAVGPDVTALKYGDRVANISGGTYASHAIVPAADLIPLPPGIDDTTIAAGLFKGLTAWMLVERCARAQAGQTALVLAAAGGVGSVLVQWLKALDVRVIAHAGSADKAEKARALGADDILSCPFADLAEAVRGLTGGRGVDAVLDGVGAASWAASLASLARRGILVTFGNASGAVPPFTALDLANAGSVFVTRPTLFHYIGEPDLLREGTARVLAMIESGAVKVEIGQTFALTDAAAAHRALESRQTTGSTVLLP